MYDNILVAIDLADQDLSNAVLDKAKHFVGSSGAHLHVITVAPSFSMPIVGSYFPEGFAENALEETRKQLAEFLEAHASDGVTVQGHVANGLIYDEIMRAANTLKCGLIVLGAHRPELKDYLLGPNAARVVRHASQSVFVVRE